VGIFYTHLPGLGGLRRPRPDSPNAGWRNLSFRGYADYMQSPEFAENVERVVDLSMVGALRPHVRRGRPWRCHRSLVGDALLVRGVRVEDIVGPGNRRPHVLTRFAQVDGTGSRIPRWMRYGS
jgi:uncharacterized protein (DUF488 family)